MNTTPQHDEPHLLLPDGHEYVVPFNPDDMALWEGDSDVDWVRGSAMRQAGTTGKAARIHPWLVPNRNAAWSMVNHNRDTVLRLLGSLMAWRICTVSQLQAGLANTPMPDFTRDRPNLYGALVTLGALNVGFSTHERLYGTPSGQTWLSIGNHKDYTRQILKRLYAKHDMYEMCSKSNLIGARLHARHNTYATHTGLILKQHPHVIATTGDGYAGFRRIDRQALAAISAQTNATPDVVSLGTNGTVVGIEVQSAVNDMRGKMRRWAQMLAASPMNRRGLLCVWLMIRIPHDNKYATIASVLEDAGNLPEMMVGTPSVAARMGVAYWDEWFTDGHPTPRLGQYTDMLGKKRNILDPQLRRFTPPPRDITLATDWGWHQVRGQLAAEWGWDTTGLPLADEYRGHFYGFCMDNDPTLPTPKGRHHATT